MKNLTNLTTLEALKVSLEHWQEDIVAPLEQGDKIIPAPGEEAIRLIWLQLSVISNQGAADSPGEGAIRLIWKSTGETVPCYARDCACCSLYGGNDWDPYVCFYYSDGLQKYCPLADDKKGACCVEWFRFTHRPTLSNALAMVARLEKEIKKIEMAEEASRLLKEGVKMGEGTLLNHRIWVLVDRLEDFILEIEGGNATRSARDIYRAIKLVILEARKQSCTNAGGHILPAK